MRKQFQDTNLKLCHLIIGLTLRMSLPPKLPRSVQNRSVLWFLQITSNKNWNSWAVFKSFFEKLPMMNARIQLFSRWRAKYFFQIRSISISHYTRSCKSINHMLKLALMLSSQTNFYPTCQKKHCTVSIKKPHDWLPEHGQQEKKAFESYSSYENTIANRLCPHNKYLRDARSYNVILRINHRWISGFTWNIACGNNKCTAQLSE